MMKKDTRNLFQKMTDEYQTALKIEDSGEQFFALQKLEKKIEEAIKPNLIDEAEIEKKWIDKGGNTLMVAGSIGAAGISIVTPQAIPWFADIFIGVVSFFGGGLIAAETVAHSIKKKFRGRNDNYVNNVMPHIPALKDLVVDIANSREQLLEERNLPQMQKSKQLSRVISERPELLNTFNKLFQKNYNEEKKTLKSGKDKKLEL